MKYKRRILEGIYRPLYEGASATANRMVIANVFEQVAIEEAIPTVREDYQKPTVEPAKIIKLTLPQRIITFLKRVFNFIFYK